MILELGQLSDFVQVTAQYSNAVLVAVLPYFSDIAKKADLPVPLPIVQADVNTFHVLPFKDMAVSMRLTNGCIFDFQSGFANRYLSPDSIKYQSRRFDDMPRPPRLKRKLDEDEAVQVARTVIGKLGIRLEDVFAEQEPQVALERKQEQGELHYHIQWLNPRGFGQVIDGGSEFKKESLVTFPAVDFEINAETGEVDEWYFTPLAALRRSPPKLSVVPRAGHGTFDSQVPPPVNPAYAAKLIPLMLKAVDEYGLKLNLPIFRPLNTNEIEKITINNNGGWPHAEIKLTNGWRFIYRHNMMNGYYAPDNLFNSDDRKIHIGEFEGKWNLTTNQAIEVVKTNLAKLGFPTNNIHMDFAPNIIYASGDFKKVIPRYFFEWEYENAAHDDLQSKVEAEVNADNGTLESLYYDDKAYWNSRPPIDVPISTEGK